MSKKLKTGVIGLGRIGQIHLANLVHHMPDAEVIIASDVSPAAHAFAERLGVPHVTTQAEDVLNHPEVEAVIICSPTPYHVPYTIAAAKQGKHVFCEKPLDVTLESIREAEQVVAENGVKLMLGFNRRFDANFSNIRQLVEAGKIGEPHILRITSRDPAPPPVEYLKVSGGIFLDMSIHDFDMARYMVGSEVTEVFVKGDALIHPEIREFGDIDTAVIVLTFENGTLGVIDNSRKAVYGYDQRLEIFGSKGMAKAENNTADSLIHFDDAGGHSSLPLHFFLERYENAYRVCLRSFIRCILDDKPSPVNAHDGLMATAIGIAAMRSLTEGRPVKISEVVQESAVNEPISEATVKA
ncbi:inositol 2-dehydrogenase [Dyadobacter sandarakinus]|uniref:Inositol 2-dehydrogenase n=1 Tax=Dyadobacter sandarakinus TaxID=2747268 RepID=A0ABX7I5Y5_9BACT|nr:inositol 2-dehydrogenase [Dyadobacter sandarakinus]QRR01195.1 inositol 2-dehydrogenase [Dyadobacter sandarakinus]